MKILIMLLASTFLCTQVVGKEVPKTKSSKRVGSSIIVHSFKKRLEFPWSCMLHTFSSIETGEIRVFCDKNNSLKSINIMFMSPDRCSVENVMPVGENRLKPIRELKNSNTNGFWFYEAEYKVYEHSDLIYKRVVKNDQECMVVITESREMAIEATAPIWQ